MTIAKISLHCILKPYFIFFDVNEHLAVPFVEGLGPVWVISVSFVYTGLKPFPKPHKLNFIYCLKFSLLLAFCFLFGWSNPNVPSSISPLGMFQGIICNIERLRGGPWSPEFLDRPKLEGRPQSPLHTMNISEPL